MKLEVLFERIISYGLKDYYVRIYEPSPETGEYSAGDWIENNTEDNTRRRITGETTHIFEESMAWLQEKANELGMPINYMFKTEDPHMRDFLLIGNGRRIVAYPENGKIDDGTSLLGIRRFTPEVF